jgi:hypothetical protein
MLASSELLTLVWLTGVGALVLTAPGITCCVKVVSVIVSVCISLNNENREFDKQKVPNAEFLADNDDGSALQLKNPKIRNAVWSQIIYHTRLARVKS